MTPGAHTWRWSCLCLGLVSVLAGTTLIGEALWLRAKAHLAEELIKTAFATHMRNGCDYLPWRWADLHPIAQLRAEKLHGSRYVLSGGSGTSMAFGIGHLDGSASPNEEGNCVLVGHRDGAFSFLGRLEVGDRLQLQTQDCCGLYEVVSRTVISERDLSSVYGDPFHRGRRLTLITCYPLGGLRATPWRYLVVCEGVTAGASVAHSDRAGHL